MAKNSTEAAKEMFGNLIMEIIKFQTENEQLKEENEKLKAEKELKSGSKQKI